jgi:hypothetical protein
MTSRHPAQKSPYLTDSVVRLDPSTGKTVATIPVASGPRFLDVGAGAVWVMTQSARPWAASTRPATGWSAAR